MNYDIRKLYSERQVIDMGENQQIVKKREMNPNSLANLRPNPGGRPALSPEQRKMKYEAMSEALVEMHTLIHNKEYLRSLKPSEKIDLLTLICDRCGLPRTTRNEFECDDIINKFSNFSTEQLQELLHKST